MRKYWFHLIYSSAHLRYSILKEIKMDYHELLSLVLFVAVIALLAGFQGAIGK